MSEALAAPIPLTLRSPRVVRTQDVKQAATMPSNAAAVISLANSRTATTQRGLRVGAAAISGINQVAGLLAACLLFGVYIGVSSVVQRALPAIAELTGIALPVSSTTALAQMDALDEDLL